MEAVTSCHRTLNREAVWQLVSFYCLPLCWENDRTGKSKVSQEIQRNQLTDISENVPPPLLWLPSILTPPPNPQNHRVAISSPCCIFKLFLLPAYSQGQLLSSPTLGLASAAHVLNSPSTYLLSPGFPQTALPRLLLWSWGPRTLFRSLWDRREALHPAPPPLDSYMPSSPWAPPAPLVAPSERCLFLCSALICPVSPGILSLLFFSCTLSECSHSTVLDFCFHKCTHSSTFLRSGKGWEQRLALRKGFSKH